MHQKIFADRTIGPTRFLLLGGGTWHLRPWELVFVVVVVVVVVVESDDIAAAAAVVVVTDTAALKTPDFADLRC